MRRLIVGATVAAALVLTGCSAVPSVCEENPNGPGCVDGREIHDAIDAKLKDHREADEKATRELLLEICAAAREAGDENACAGD